MTGKVSVQCSETATADHQNSVFLDSVDMSFRGCGGFHIIHQHMRILVTGSAGHLGESLVRSLQDSSYEAVGIDILDSPFTAQVGSITDRAFVARCMEGVEAVLHAASLHKPHVATHSRQAFVDINIIGTLNLLEQAVRVPVALKTSSFAWS